MTAVGTGVGASLREDVGALAAMERGSASPGERRSGEWIAARLREAGADEVGLEEFRYQTTYAGVHALHVAGGLLGARRGGVLGSALTLAALASLELDASGRSQWLRRFLPAGEGTNVVGRIRARRDGSAGDGPAGDRGSTGRGTLVLVAHHDAARTGVSWDPRLVKLGARPGVMPPRMGLVGLGFALAAVPRLRRAGRALLWLALAGYADIARERTVPGANDNATGVAALLALARRLASEPLEHADVVLLAPGCEESGMGGMAAWLRAHGAALDPARTLVLSLDTLGSGTPIVVEAETTLAPHAYRDEELALAEAGAARAGADPPRRWRVGAWTDAVLARVAGLPAISLLSVGPDGIYTDWHLPTDTPDRVDFASVEACTRIAEGIAREWDARASVR
ncbi:MAG TPA: M20/M25/M40 family metallo-hydrolase [Solirubrobacteraceae bacterium]|nr:M20/M25/M40 family metallo-hydrolase [Solirubrobacteraceae bacterium]